MTALTAAYDAKRKDGQLVAMPMAAATKIYKGSLVSVTTATGFVSPSADTAATVFVGVAHETIDNTAGAAGALNIRVEKVGVYTFPSSGAVQTDVGKTALIIDSGSCKTAATTNSIPCGIVQSFISATLIAIRIDGKVA